MNNLRTHFMRYLSLLFDLAALGLFLLRDAPADRCAEEVMASYVFLASSAAS